MTKAMRKQYTLEFNKEAVRLVESGQSLASGNRRLRAQLARVTKECDILGRATAFFAKGQR